LINRWEVLGNTQGVFKNTPVSNLPTSRDGRIPFSTGLDIAQNVPKNPGGWQDDANNALEAGRKGALNVVSKANPILLGGTIGLVGGPVGAAAGAATGAAVLGIDKVTDGGATKVLQAGQKNLRSNYAFVRDVADQDAAMGLFAGLTMVAGGVIGGVLGSAFGPAGTVIGAGLGANLVGKLTRETAQSDLGKSISDTLYKSAKFSSTDVGQEKYNLGRDVVHTAAKITTWNTLGDTTKGIGAITSGAVNFVAEGTLGADVLAARGVGIAARKGFVRPITEPMHGITKKIYSKTEADRVGKRLAADIDLIDRTLAGEKTPYTPVFDFYQKNDVSTLVKRKEFDSETGKMAAALLAGETPEVQAKIIKIGRGDPNAYADLALTRADKFAELTRLDDALEYVNTNGIFSLQYKGQTIVMSKRFKSNIDMVAAEVESLKKEVNWLNDALDLKGQLKNRTVSKWAVVEKVRNDFAKENAARGLASKDIASMETTVGKTYQWFYQKNPLSRPIRGLDRMTDDAPRQVINYNEPLNGTVRMQTSLRSAEKHGASIPTENVKIMDNWLKARTEVEKTAVIENYVSTGMKLIAAKYGISVPVIELAIEKYNTSHRRLRDEAVTARELKQGYMNDPQDPTGPLIADAQLITQLANGAILPDWKFVDGVLKDFSKNYGNTTKIQQRTDNLVYLADELNSLWRTGTLLRTGYPANVIKDSYIRAWGDLAIFDMFKYAGQDIVDSIANSGNTVAKVSSWAKSVSNPKYNIKKVRQDITARQTILDVYDKTLLKAKYDVKNPPKVVPAALQKDVDLRNSLASTIDVLRQSENKLVSGIKEKRVFRPTTKVDGETFESAFAGRFGALYKQKISQKDDLRAAVAGVRELQIETARRGRTGAGVVLPTDEVKHLQSWSQILNDKIKFDPVARLIMQGKSKKEVVAWLRSPEGFEYLDRFSENLRDAPKVYERVKVPLDMYAPSKAIRDLIITDKLDLVALKKLYPDINQRPPVYGDLVDDMTGASSLSRDFRQKAKDTVVWMSTVPTARLAFSPYFRVKYEQELQNQIWLANATKTPINRSKFEANARAFAINEYKEKMNSFHRDMNYSGFINYILAFFPAVVEQFRAYGRITMDNPDFIIKKMMISTIPERIGQVEEDANGNRYMAVKLGVLGLESRLPVEWFNPDNPTGGSLISFSPIAAASVNQIAKTYNIENYFTDKVLPFGVQRNSLNALTPNTGRRLFQLWQASNKTGDQFNKDSYMFQQQLWEEYVRKNGKDPSVKKFEDITKESEKRAVYLSILRTISAATLPVQGRVVTSVSGYVDILNKYQTKFGDAGAEQFSLDYPDAYMFMDRLSDATSGVNPDATAAALVKKNMGGVKSIMAAVGPDNATVLGAIFNDDEYAFSSAAQAYLQDTKIPGAGNKKFRDISGAFDATRSAIVGKGWKDYFALRRIIGDELSRANINPNGQYADTIMKKYQASFVEAQKEQNNMWWQEYEAQSKGGSGSRQAATVTALTVALNDDKLWKDLSKQPKFHMIADYLKFRYTVKDKLDRMNTTIDSIRASSVRRKVASVVAEMRAADINFDKFYSRYFENDKFDFVYEEPGA